jgi:hypothetical protein
MSIPNLDGVHFVQGPWDLWRIVLFSAGQGISWFFAKSSLEEDIHSIFVVRYNPLQHRCRKTLILGLGLREGGRL